MNPTRRQRFAAWWGNKTLMRFSHPEYNRSSDMYVSFADQTQLAKWSHDRGHNFTEDTLWFGEPVGIRANTKQHTIEHIHSVAKHYGIIPVIDPEEVAPSVRELKPGASE